MTALHLKGDDKLDTLAKAASAVDQVNAMPIRGFLKPGLKVFWSA
jgi:6-phosphogluconolactonase